MTHYCRHLVPVLAAVLATAGCDRHGDDEHGHEHGEGEHGHEHGEEEHGHEHGEEGHGHEHGEEEHGHERGGDHGHGHDDHGHGFDGASEVVTLWGDPTQLFVEFPALVVGEESPFAAHLTRLNDHFPIDVGSVVVELTGGNNPVERFSVDQPSVPGIFRPVVTPAETGPRQVVLRLESSAGSESHEMGEFRVFASREEANAAAGEEAEADGEISYLLEQQWVVPFRIQQVTPRMMRPSFPAFARLAVPSDAESLVTAPRDGGVRAVDGRFPVVGDSLDAGAVIFQLSASPDEAVDPASADLAVSQANIRVESAQREVDRLQPLVEQGVVAQRRLDEATSALADARAVLRGARRQRANLGSSESVEGGADQLAVPSPIAGDIAELLVAPGAWVTGGAPLARVVNRERLWLDVGVPETYVGRLGDISGAWFELDSVSGVIEVPGDALVSVGTEVDPATRTLPVRFRLENIRSELFAGMTTQAHLIADSPQLTVAVPTDALIDDNGTDVVFVQTGGESFERRPVILGVRDGRYVEALAGVVAGDWVVTQGAYQVKLASTSTESIGHGHAH